jgi:hypothetical protein
VLAYLKQNAPARGRTLLLISVMIEAMITFIAVQDNTRIGLFGQSLFPNIGACSQCYPEKPGREAVSLSTEPTNWVRDNGIRVFYTLIPDSPSLISGSAFSYDVRFSYPWLMSTGGSHQYHDVLSVGVGA